MLTRSHLQRRLLATAPSISLGIALIFLAVGCGGPTPPPETGEIDLTQPPDDRAPALVPPAPRRAPSSTVHRDDPGQPQASPAETRRVEKTVWRVPVEDHDPIRGPEDALVTVVVFSDFECPFCKRAASTLEKLHENYPQSVRLVWKDFPLPSHPQADFAAHFAQAVRAQKGDEAFWEAHDRLFARQPKFDNDSLYQIAHAIGGLRWDVIRGDIREQRHGRGIYEDLKLAERLDVSKTPTLFVNGRKIVGAPPLAELEALVEEQLARARQRIEAGTPRDRLYESIIAEGRQLEAPSDLSIP